MDIRPNAFQKQRLIREGQPRRIFPSNNFISVFCISFFLLSGDVLAQTIWHDRLSYGGGGYWTSRIPVEIQNPGAFSIEGMPIQLTIDESDGLSALIGAPVASLRAAMAEGPELIFDLQDARGVSKRSGHLEAGDVLYLPVQAAPGSAVVVYLYTENAEAWLPPEWLRAALSNLSFEHGEDDPVDWQTLLTDTSHRMSLDREVFRSGGQSARCDVDSGALPTWVKYYQGDLPVAPGQRYRFTAWVKGENVSGCAGWYVHVNGIYPQMVNQGQCWDGTFDWRQVVLEFEIPEGAATFECGTMLYGSGTAWYDDADLELVEGGTPLTFSAGAVEHYTPVNIGGAINWPGDESWGWRLPIHIRNASSELLNEALVILNTRYLQSVWTRFFGYSETPGYLFLDAENPETPIPYTGDGAEGIQFVTSLPPNSHKTVWAVLDGNARGPAHSPLIPFADWASSAYNLTPNGGMESGEGEVPEVWVAALDGAGVTARRVEGGVEGNWCLELHVPPPVNNQAWPGWRQRVPVQPNTRYLISGYIKGENLSGPVPIYAHLRKADGSLSDNNPYVGTSPFIQGTQDWQRTSTVVLTPPDCAFIELHLTMNQSGTLWHDAVFVSPIVEAETGLIESRITGDPVPDAWVVDPLIKTFQEDRPPKHLVREVDVATARNTRKTFQIALYSPVSGSAQVHATPLIGPGEAVLDPPAIARAGYVPIDFPIGYDVTTAPAFYRHLPWYVDNDGWAGWWPDPLIPVTGDALSIEAEQCQPLYFEVTIPAGAREGLYQGQVVIGLAGRQIQVPVSLTVWNFTSPEEKHLPAILDLRGGPGWNIFSGHDGHDEAARRWYRFLARYNVSPGLIEPYPYFHYENGQVVMDTAKFDEMAAFLLDELKVNKVYTPDLFYACGWAYTPQRIFGLEPFSPEYNQAWTDAYTLFINHITAKGWRDKFILYLSDEPHKTSEVTITSLAQIADMARAIAPDVPVYSSTWEYIDGLANHLNCWGIGPQGSFDPVRLEERRAAGDRFIYTTDGQMCTDTPLLAIERLLPWFCFRYDVEAYEFWSVAWWTYNPWNYGWHRYIRQSDQGEEWYFVRYPNGDGFLTYPSRDIENPEPLPSIRLVAVRDGVEDYEIFLALDAVARQGDTEAQAMLDRVRAVTAMPNRGGRYSSYLMPDPKTVQTLRREAGDLLSRLNSAATASLQVNIAPERARNNGAQWRVDGGSWRESGVMLDGLDAGTHVVLFKEIDGWTAPESLTVILSPETPLTMDVEYQRHLGVVAINVVPVTAPWSLTDGDGEIQNGTGATVLDDIPSGTITLHWGELPGYRLPAQNPVTGVLLREGLLHFFNTYIPEGGQEGNPQEGEEGEGENSTEGQTGTEHHSADQNRDGAIDLSELLRVIQFYNSNGYHCQAGTEDGYAPGSGDITCKRHSSDYLEPPWRIYLSELLRLIQFYNIGGYYACPNANPPTEDGFCPVFP